MTIYKKPLKYFATVIILFVVLIFLMQIIVVRFMGGVGGSFGLRPQTHGCLGFPIKPNLVNLLPDGFIELDMFLHFRYQISYETPSENYCLGQDTWFGE